MSKILISLPEEMLSQIDILCKSNMMNRAEFIRSAIRTFISPTMTEKQFQASLDNATGDSDGSVALGKVPDYTHPEKMVGLDPIANNLAPEHQDDFIIPALSVLMCRYCRVRKECNKVVYSDPDGNDEEYFVCPDDMKQLDKHVKNYGGRIVSVNGKSYE